MAVVPDRFFGPKLRSRRCGPWDRRSYERLVAVTDRDHALVVATAREYDSTVDAKARSDFGTNPEAVVAEASLGEAKPIQPRGSDPVPLQQIRLSSSTLDAISRCTLLGSAALYGIGLLVANFNAQLYGRYSLGLVEAQYVLVGLLWLVLTLLGFAVTRSALRWMKAHGPWRGRPRTQNVKNLLLVAGGWLGLLGVYLQIMNFLGVANAYVFWLPWLVLGILVMNNLTLGALFQETWQDMQARGTQSDSFLVKLWKVDSIQISKRVLYFFTALSLYATFVYPQLSAAVGGGKLHQAEIIIRQDRRSLFDSMVDFKIDKAGKLGPVTIVAESDQSLIVTASDKPWWELARRSLQLKKDLVELVIYTK